MDWKRILEILFFWFFPFAILFYLLYRAIWSLSGLWFAGWKPTQNNIKIVTQWGRRGVEFQEEYGTWVNGNPVHPFQDWLNGFKKIYLLPLVLFGWGFYSGLTWGRNDPQKAN